ncbi:MAG: D-apionolactonase [Verrucomicrobiota bacterium]|jgi:hypothetical protein
MLSTAFLQSGRAPARPLELRAGPLTMHFEPETAFLRRIRLGGDEVIRAIYAAVRHQDWSTIPPQVTLTQQHVGPDSFHLAFDVHCTRGPVNYTWQGDIKGDASGRVRFEFDGISKSDFLRNRIGICVLHPIEECRGKSLSIEHSDGSLETGTFPDDIAPHQPFFDIRAMSCNVMKTGAIARLEMAGDAFEMEDQRNWSDASFKTYCTPLARPLPHPVKVGDRVQQSVVLTLGGKIPAKSLAGSRHAPQLTIGTSPIGTVPPLGLCVASHERALTAAEVDRLKVLKVAHLRVDLRLNDPAYPSRLEQAWNEARALEAGLHIALELGAESGKALAEFARHLERIQPRVLLWIILHETENPARERTVREVAPALQGFAPEALLAAGTRDFFTEINRCRPDPKAVSSVCYSTNPQVHAFDNITLVENLAGQVYNVESARQFSPRPVVLSPITLRLRNNARAADEKAGSVAELPSDVDPRQLSLLGAGWTLGSIAKLTQTGFVQSLTYFETTGWRGVMQDAGGSPLPAEFPSEPGDVFPIYHVLADLAEFGKCQVLPTHTTDPLVAEALALVNEMGRRRILVANLSGDPLELGVQTGPCSARVRCLDETTAETAIRRPQIFRRQEGEVQNAVSGRIKLKLLPFALARIDVG